MKTALILAMLLILPGVFASSHCEEAYEGMVIKEDTTLCSDSFEVLDGIRIGADNVMLDCSTAVIKGLGKNEGIIIENVSGVTVQNCNIINYNVGIYLKNATFAYLHDNALLKNKVGIRLYQSFENRIENNADKSLTKAIGSIASKFNSLWISNKNIEKEFCDVNLCNQAGPMDPCANDDFYCSPQCSWENDNDCPAPEKPKEIVEKEPSKAEQLVAEAEASLAKPTKKKPIVKKEEPKKPEWMTWHVQLAVYLLMYILGFIFIQHHFFSHRRKD